MRHAPRDGLRATTYDSLNLDPSFARSALPTDASLEGEPEHSPMTRGAS